MVAAFNSTLSSACHCRRPSWLFGVWLGFEFGGEAAAGESGGWKQNPDARQTRSEEMRAAGVPFAPQTLVRGPAYPSIRTLQCEEKDIVSRKNMICIRSAVTTATTDCNRNLKPQTANRKPQTASNCKRDVHDHDGRIRLPHPSASMQIDLPISIRHHASIL